MNGYDGHASTWELQAQVKGDLRVIGEYGERHPAHYGGLWLKIDVCYGISSTESSIRAPSQGLRRIVAPQGVR